MNVLLLMIILTRKDKVSQGYLNNRGYTTTYIEALNVKRVPE